MSAQSLGSRAILGRMYQKLTTGPIGWVDRLSFLVESDQGSEEHRWLGMSPAMREWISGRLVHGLRDAGIVIKNLSFEASIAVFVDEIRRDKTGQVMARVDQLVGRYNQHGAKLLSELMIAGESSVCYDGQYFFDTDHSEGESGTQSNSITVDISALPVPSDEQGSTTDPSAKTMQKVILQAIAQIYGFKDDQGEPINETATEFLVQVPTTLFVAAAEAATNAAFAGGETNALASMRNFKVEVVPNPRLTWTDKIGVFRADGGDGVKPFIRQQETPLNIAYQAEGSPEEFYNKRHVYGIDYNGNFGLGMWQHACLAQLI